MHIVIVDTDPGIDDALALLLALTSPEDIHVAGITTVVGNASLDTTTNNALKILALADFANRQRIPVFRGCQRPSMVTAPSKHTYYGEDGLGDIDLARSNEQPDVLHAVDFLIDKVMTQPPKTVTLCAIAPLTNVAMACVKEPRFAVRLAAIHIMGGDAVSKTPEFNFRCDPKAAAIVLQSDATIKLFGFDVTRQVTIARQMYDELAECHCHGDALSAVRSMLAYCMKQESALHDICVIASLIDASLFDFTQATIEVEWRDKKNRGSCTVQRVDTQSNQSVACGVDTPKLANIVVSRIIRLGNLSDFCVVR